MVAGISEKFSLDALVVANNFDYYDFGNQVSFRVYQQNDSGSAKILSIDQVLISFEAVYEDQFAATGNNFTEIFPSTTTDFAPVYPHKNPQDDL